MSSVVDTWQMTFGTTYANFYDGDKTFANKCETL